MSSQIAVADTAKKSLRVNVTTVSTEAAIWVIRASLDFEVEAGNGYRLKRSIKHGSPTWIGRTLNGAVALAVIAILNDQKIVEYLTSPP
jgi:hypothetical protein